MKKLGTRIAALSFFLALAAPGAALADGDRHRGSHHHHHHYRGHWQDDHRHHRRGQGERHRRWDRHHDRGRHHVTRQRGPNFATFVRACHPMTRIEYRHGRMVRMGELLCYDNRGRSFVLPGSRHIIAYLF